jgi:hypothetical protein
MATAQQHERYPRHEQTAELYQIFIADSHDRTHYPAGDS